MTVAPRIVHLARTSRIPKVWTEPFVSALEARGRLTLVEQGANMDDDEAAALVGAHDVAIVGWDARPLPRSLATSPGSLAYVCSYSGTVRATVPRELVAAGIAVSNWGDLPAYGVAESAMTLLLTCVHDMPVIRQAQLDGAWTFDRSRTGTLRGLAVGIVGLGVIGRRFVEMLRPFGATMLAHDPHVHGCPPDVEPVADLEALCDRSEALVIHAGLTPETHGLVTADHLARLPDGGIVVNTARGEIIDQDALFAELATGRLRAGLDVLDGEGPQHFPADHPLRRAPNATFTFHQLSDEGGDPWPQRATLTPMQQGVVDQLDRFVAGHEPRWLFDVDRYDRST